jgi:3-methylcrotonyl-CoA carboxylase alpha subunit
VLELHEQFRVDTGVQAGDEVSPFYDPMIAKIIVRGRDRAQALQLMEMAFYRTVIAPLRTNGGFLSRLVQFQPVLDGEVHTGLIESNMEALAFPDDVAKTLTEDAATALVASYLHQTYDIEPGIHVGDIDSLSDVWRAAVGFRANGRPAKRVTLFTSSDAIDINLPNNFRSRRIHSYFDRGGSLSVMRYGETLTFKERGSHRSSAGSSSGDILSPMPGRIIAVEVAQGQTVTKGQKLLTLEAMKMEHSLTAPFDGVVAELNATAGAQVQVEALMVRIEPS